MVPLMLLQILAERTVSCSTYATDPWNILSWSVCEPMRVHIIQTGHSPLLGTPDCNLLRLLLDIAVPQSQQQSNAVSLPFWRELREWDLDLPCFLFVHSRAAVRSFASPRPSLKCLPCKPSYFIDGKVVFLLNSWGGIRLYNPLHACSIILLSVGIIASLAPRTEL